MDSAAAGTEAGGGTDAVTTTTTTCACCGMDEECTPRYVARVAAQFGWAWVCGLCAEAARRGVGLGAARRAHAEFVGSAGSGRPAAHVVRALLQLIKKVIAAAVPAGTAAAVLPPRRRHHTRCTLEIITA